MQGDGSDIAASFRKQRFDLIVSDLPYGVQHTSNTARNPMETLEKCAVSWAEYLAPNGAVILAFNSNNPKRAALERLFTDANWHIAPVHAPHRMSESILRDVLIARR